MCFSTRKFRFLDIINFLAPGYSYDKYLKAYGCELQKGHFPYEYMDGIGKLEDRALPPQEAFYSRLKNEHISDDDYSLCQVPLRDNRMKTMRDFLMWYNNLDVVPFLDAIDKQFAFYKQQNIDMFKYCVSVPGLTLLYLKVGQPPARGPDPAHEGLASGPPPCSAITLQSGTRNPTQQKPVS